MHNGTVIVPPAGVSGGNIQLPAGVGGGYVTTGPFANMTVNLGPVGGLAGVAAGPDGGLGYNPRTLKRDLGPAMNERYCNYTTVFDLMEKDNITNYRLLSEGVPYTVEVSRPPVAQLSPGTYSNAQLAGSNCAGILRLAPMEEDTTSSSKFIHCSITGERLADIVRSGDPGGDLFTSPGDPAFWVHHGQVRFRIYFVD